MSETNRKPREELLTLVATYNDERILNTINQSFNFSQEMVNAAKHIADSRGLVYGTGVSNPDLHKTASQMMESGISVENIVEKLKGDGFEENQILEAVHDAAKYATVDQSARKNKKEGSSSWSVWTVVIIAFFVFRVVFRCANNN